MRPITKVIGKKTEKILELPNFTSYKKIIVDLGTGDGRFVYENAKYNPENFYIGIDTLAKTMEEFSGKLQRENISNAIFIIGNAENFLDDELNLADELYINFPWRNLLALCVDPSEIFLKNILRVLKNNGLVFMVFGYSEEFEQKQVIELNLPKIDFEFIQTKIAKKYNENGFELVAIEELTKSQIYDIGSSWGKTLKFGRDRDVFKMVLRKKINE